ncbi:Long-chain-fatty-acid--CoA ligase 5 [Thoreauomyces humboldtii]|nr:Long-chain-fatty-acid--CoA ligase 5 [Thoreauomyces humboldtii]
MPVPTPRYELPDRITMEVLNAPEVQGEGKPRTNYLTYEREYRVNQFGKRSLWDNFQKGRQSSGDSPCFGHRQVVDGGVVRAFLWDTYDEVHARAGRIGSALVTRGLKSGDNVAIFGRNSSKYAVTQLATWRQNGTVVPIYETLISDESILVGMLNQFNSSVLFVSSKQLPSVLAVCGQVTILKTIVSFENVSDADVEKAGEAGVDLLTFDDLEELGAGHPVDATPGKPSDVAFICATSGTTGLPKGVILTHSMCTAAVDSYTLRAEHGLTLRFGPTDVVLSYLPMAHVFEMLCQAQILYEGGRIGFWQGDVSKLMEDVQELKPTVFAGTPRIYNRLYDGVMSQINKVGWLQSTLFQTAYQSKVAGVRKGVYEHSLWDTTVFGKLKNILGGRVRLLITGAAPISVDVANFLKVAFSVPVFEGYGQTEGTATCTFGDVGAGHVVPGAFVKLVDVPEMNYLSSSNPPAGEVCYRSPFCLPGYYNDPVKTAEVLDADGWVHSGDIGVWTPSGCLAIVDRKKNLFKLSQGEYVSPEKVETVYSRHEILESVFVTGNSSESFLVAVLCPHRSALLKLIWERGGLVDVNVEELSFEQVCAHPVVKRLLVAELAGWVRKGKELKGFEIVRNAVLSPVPFADMDLLTPTHKLKRHAAQSLYSDQVRALYEEGTL